MNAFISCSLVSYKCVVLLTFFCALTHAGNFFTNALISAGSNVFDNTIIKKNKLQVSSIVSWFLYSGLALERLEIPFSRNCFPNKLGFWIAQKIFFVMLLFFSSSTPISSVLLGISSRSWFDSSNPESMSFRSLFFLRSTMCTTMIDLIFTLLFILSTFCQVIILPSDRGKSNSLSSSSISSIVLSYSSSSDSVTNNAASAVL